MGIKIILIKKYTKTKNMKNIMHNRPKIEYNGIVFQFQINKYFQKTGMKQNHSLVFIKNKEYVINAANGFIYPAI